MERIFSRWSVLPDLQGELQGRYGLVSRFKGLDNLVAGLYIDLPDF